MQLNFNEEEKESFYHELQHLFKEAYAKGVQDGIEHHSLPAHLRKKDLAKFFNVSEASVENIIRMDGFPRSKVIKARYPRDLVMKWAYENVDNLYYYKSRTYKAMRESALRA